MPESGGIQIIREYKPLSADVPVLHIDYVQDYHARSELHYHNCMEIGYCVSGKGTMIINNTVSSFEAGTVTVIREGCIHDSHIVTQSKDEARSVWKFIFTRPELIGIRDVADFAGFSASDKKLVALFHMMYSELELLEADYQKLFINLLSAFLRYAERITPKSYAVAPSALSPEMAATMNRIHTNYSVTLTLEDLAQACNMSVSSYCRMFRRYFGVAPIAYVNNLRLTIAKQFLETSEMPIVEIATFVGYLSLSSFNRLFLKKFGQAPREVRKLSRQKKRIDAQGA